jgi:hypothetical protein
MINKTLELYRQLVHCRRKEVYGINPGVLHYLGIKKRRQTREKWLMNYKKNQVQRAFWEVRIKCC